MPSTTQTQPTFAQKFRLYGELPEFFEPAVFESFLKEFISKKMGFGIFVWSIGLRTGDIRIEEFYKRVLQLGFASEWYAYADRKNIRRYRGNCLQDWCLPRRTFFFWSE